MLRNFDSNILTVLDDVSLLLSVTSIEGFTCFLMMRADKMNTLELGIDKLSYQNNSIMLIGLPVSKESPGLQVTRKRVSFANDVKLNDNNASNPLYHRSSRGLRKKQIESIDTNHYEPKLELNKKVLDKRELIAGIITSPTNDKATTIESNNNISGIMSSYILGNSKAKATTIESNLESKNPEKRENIETITPIIKKDKVTAVVKNIEAELKMFDKYPVIDEKNVVDNESKQHAISNPMVMENTNIQMSTQLNSNTANPANPATQWLRIGNALVPQYPGLHPALAALTNPASNNPAVTNPAVTNPSLHPLAMQQLASQYALAMHQGLQQSQSGQPSQTLPQFFINPFAAAQQQPNSEIDKEDVLMVQLKMLAEEKAKLEAQLEKYKEQEAAKVVSQDGEDSNVAQDERSVIDLINHFSNQNKEKQKELEEETFKGELLKFLSTLSEPCPISSLLNTNFIDKHSIPNSVSDLFQPKDMLKSKNIAIGHMFSNITSLAVSEE